MIELPPGKYFMVMWNIAQQFGGMTSMCMARARNFLTYAGVNAPVLSFSLTGRYKALEQSLIKRGYLLPENKVLNVFEYYRERNLGEQEPVQAPDWRSRRPDRSDFRHEQLLDQDGLIIANVFRDDENAIVYRECFRADGSVFFVDHSELDNNDKRTKRQVWLINKDGEPVGTYAGASQFYYAWLDELTGNERSTFIFDDKSAATILRRYHRPNVLMVTPIHSNHIKSAGDHERGELDPNREKIFKESWRWDSLVFLTDTQHREYTARYGSASNLAVIPNPVKIPEDDSAAAQRNPARGVIIGRLAKSKNLAAAIEAVRLARESVPDLVLDIYGEGEQREELEELIVSKNLQGAVHLHGHVTGAAREFATAGFSLMTSRYEGFPLAALESLSRGCPLISFDLRYGPPDLIGKDAAGFTVPVNDIDAMANRIVQICTDKDMAQRMGEAGRRRAQACSSESVTQAWADLVRRLWQEREIAPPVASVQCNATAHKDVNQHIEVALDLRWSCVAGRQIDKSDIDARLRIVPETSGPALTRQFELHDLIESGVSGSLSLDPGVALSEADGTRNTLARVEVVGAVRQVPFSAPVTLVAPVHWDADASPDGHLRFTARRSNAL
ncbi:glycosyltransferase [Microlunatus elymi]|uniref:Glycosyltransferase n=1 Tax=Microlunatus elymi TaxID=2596828 RepID=A0A516Q016_9ACTN|nr:glycosyltransferase [Microlunatus elymi]QDP96561.1 glycosyltransferase [Microlunatus elymi]